MLLSPLLLLPAGRPPSRIGCGDGPSEGRFLRIIAHCDDNTEPFSRKGDTPDSPSRTDQVTRQDTKPQPRLLKKLQPKSLTDFRKKKESKGLKNERLPQLSLSDLGKVNAYFAEIPPEYLVRHDQLQSAKTAMFKSSKGLEPKLISPTLDDANKVGPDGFYFTPDSAGWDEADVSLPVALLEDSPQSHVASTSAGLYNLHDLGSVGSLASLSVYWENRERAKKRGEHDELDLVIPRRHF